MAPKSGRLCAKAVFTGFKRGLRNQNENNALLKVEGCEDKDDAEPKRDKSNFRGRRGTRSHGNAGNVRPSVKFRVLVALVVMVYSFSGREVTALSCYECKESSPCAPSELTLVDRPTNTVCYIKTEDGRVVAAGGTRARGRCVALGMDCCNKEGCNALSYSGSDVAIITVGCLAGLGLLLGATLYGLYKAGKICGSISGRLETTEEAATARVGGAGHGWFWN